MQAVMSTVHAFLFAQRREYAAGEYLAQEGERADEIFYIEAGAVEICYSRRQAADEDLLDDAVRPLQPWRFAPQHYRAQLYSGSIQQGVCCGRLLQPQSLHSEDLLDKDARSHAKPGHALHKLQAYSVAGYVRWVHHRSGFCGGVPAVSASQSRTVPWAEAPKDAPSCPALSNSGRVAGPGGMKVCG